MIVDDLTQAEFELVDLTQDDPAFQWKPGVLFRLPSSLSQHNFETLVVHAYRSGASDINLTSGDYVWFSYHGWMHRASNRQLMDSDIAMIITCASDSAQIGAIQGAQPLNRALEVRPQNIRNTKYRYRLNAVACRAGEVEKAVQLTLRTIPSTPVDIETLNIEPELRKHLIPPNGMVLICGTTNSGKTTLIFSLLRHVAETDPNKKIITAEDPVEFVFTQVKCKGMIPTQMEIGRDCRTYKEAIKQTTRRAAHIQLIGETRDAEEFRMVFDVTNQGITVYTSLHTGTVDGVVRRVLDTFPMEEKPAMASSFLENIRVIVCQKLLRTITGKRAAIREWLVFDRATKATLAEMPFEQWSGYIRNRLWEEGQAMPMRALTLLDQGIISEEIYHEDFGLSSASVRREVARIQNEASKNGV